jgi:hypothetical protein
VKAEWLSEKYVLFEGSDPTFWCPRGYVRGDRRGPVAISSLAECG